MKEVSNKKLQNDINYNSEKHEETECNEAKIIEGIDYVKDWNSKRNAK